MQVLAIVVTVAITLVAVALAAKAVTQMVAVIGLGQPLVGRRDHRSARWATMFKETLGHTRMLQWTWIGVMHWFVFAGFILLSSLVATAYGQIFLPTFALPVIGHWFVYEWFADILSWLTAVGIAYLILVRQKDHPRRLGRGSRFFGSTFWQAYFVEAIILGVVICGLLLRGLEYARGEGTRWDFPLTWFIGAPFEGLALGTIDNLIFAIAMIKIVISMSWLITISRNITMGVAWHRFTVWTNIWFKREAGGGIALGGLQPIMVGGQPLDFENIEEIDEDAPLGAGKIEDFSWKGILDFSTCTECGRCQSQCPAWATDKPLSPKLLIMGLRDHAYAKAPYLQTPADEREQLSEAVEAEAQRPLIASEDLFGVIDPDVLWSCTSCGACVQQCPVDIEHVDHIMDMRRYQVLVESNFPPELNQLFKGLENKGNPWNMSTTARMDWAKDLDFEVKQVGGSGQNDPEDLSEVEYLFWVGCAGAYEDRAKKTTRAVAELLHMADVDFAVLGDGETCSGDPARRAGNEFVFSMLAMQNAEVFKDAKAKKVVATCAHCFNTLANEYAEFGVALEVVHHTQLLNRLVREGRLTPVAPGGNAPATRTITYHDPCYLGRHNQVYEPPREILGAIPGTTFTEMPRNSERSFCCGAGGARMWMEEKIGERINVNRTIEAVATGADQIAVGCPFCRVMLSDGLTLQQSEGQAREEVEVLDIAQMLLASLRRDGDADAAIAAAEPDEADAADPHSITEHEQVGPSAAAASTGSAHAEGPAPSGTDAAAAHNEPVDDRGSALDESPDDPSTDAKPAGR